MYPTSGVRNIIIMSYEYINDKVIFTSRKLRILGRVDFKFARIKKKKKN